MAVHKLLNTIKAVFRTPTLWMTLKSEKTKNPTRQSFQIERWPELWGCIQRAIILTCREDKNSGWEQCAELLTVGDGEFHPCPNQAIS